MSSKLKLNLFLLLIAIVAVELFARRKKELWLEMNSFRGKNEFAQNSTDSTNIPIQEPQTLPKVKSFEELNPPSIAIIQKELGDNPHQLLTPSMQAFILKMSESMEIALKNPEQALIFKKVLTKCINESTHKSTQKICEKNLIRLNQ